MFPETTAEVAPWWQPVRARRVPVIAFGMGSSLEGHVNAVRGGVSIDLTRMTRVIQSSVDDLDVTVEAGLTHRKLNDHLKNTGLMFPVDPGADATLGGMTATRASGTTAVRYGTMRENVLGLTVVLADGRVIHTGGRARKSSSGYDLTRLFVGSEGTLGVITEITLRLFGRPEAVTSAVCPFANMAGAAATVITTIQLGIPVARIEIIDEQQLTLVNRYSKTSFPRGADAVLRVPRSQRGVGGRAGARGRRDRARERRASGFSGHRRRKSARRYGRRATTRCMRRWRRAPAPGPGPPMSAFRSRACPSASSRRRTTCAANRSSRRWSAMRATATFI